MTTQHAETGTIDVPTRSGTVRGVRRDHDAVFLGIPFAEPPTGPQRFAAPAPHRPWDGARPATAFGATPQRRPFGEMVGIPEPSIPGDSTLNVNVFTPAAGDREAKLPVYVWIHGGGWFAGSPAGPWYDGASFTRDGVVFVSLSYRLGVDGYGWIDGAPLNRGQLDQLAALEWVHENIRSFGGDPDRVTIGGQSAGGGSVLALLSTPRSRGLIAGAISHSGALAAIDAETAEQRGRDYARSLGIRPTLQEWRRVEEERILDTERAVNTSPWDVPPEASLGELLSRLGDPIGRSAGHVFAPCVDGDIVRADFSAGPQVPLLQGRTRHEFAFPGADELDDLARLLEERGVRDTTRRTLLAEIGQIGGTFARSQLHNILLFTRTLLTVGAHRREDGLAASTWQFAVDWPSQTYGLAQHCVDLPFAFDLLDAEAVDTQLGDAPPQHLADAMHGAWISFLAEGRAPWPTTADSATGAQVFADESRYQADRYSADAELIALAATQPPAGPVTERPRR